MFYDDCAYLAEWPGPPIGDEEGRIIHETLGDKRAISLAHHGYGRSLLAQDQYILTILGVLVKAGPSSLEWFSDVA